MGTLRLCLDIEGYSCSQASIPQLQFPDEKWGCIFLSKITPDKDQHIFPRPASSFYEFFRSANEPTILVLVQYVPEMTLRFVCLKVDVLDVLTMGFVYGDGCCLDERQVPILVAVNIVSLKRKKEGIYFARKRENIVNRAVVYF